MLASEQVSQVVLAGERVVVLSLSFAYLNPPTLGRCVLGDAVDQAVRADLTDGAANPHLYWVGVGGQYRDLFGVQRIYFVQGARRFDPDIRRPIDTDTRLGEIDGIDEEYLLVFEQPIDVTEPITIFYQSGIGTYSGEYWLPDEYLGDLTGRRE